MRPLRRVCLLAVLVQLTIVNAPAAQTPQLVADIIPGGAGSGASPLRTWNGELYFLARQPGIGRELWKTDGTSEGTSLVADLNPGTEWSDAADFIEADGRLFFSAGYQPLTRGMHVLDTSGVITRLSDHVSSPYGEPRVAVLDGTVHFLTYVLNDPAPNQLWRTDGTEAGTMKVAEHVSSNGNFLMATTDRLFFFTKQPSWQLWTSDGTESGTEPIASAGEVDDALILANKLLYLVVPAGPPSRRELWVSDGTEAGTQLLRTLTAESSYELEIFDGAAYFADETAGGDAELWRTDGTPIGTELVSDLPSAETERIWRLTASGDLLYFQTRNPDDGWSLWRTDGTEAGTHPVRSFSPEPGGIGTMRVPADGSLFFVAWDRCHGTEPWRSDGTAEGTVRAAEMTPGPSGTDLNAGLAVGNVLYLGASSPATGEELWKLQIDEDPPVFLCGNGQVDAGEECDLGDDLNGLPSCCACDCTFAAASTLCGPSTGSCDLPEYCTGSDVTCPADAGGPTPKGGTLKYKRLGEPVEDDVFQLDFTVVQVSYADPASNDGFRIVIAAQDGSTLLELAAPYDTWEENPRAPRIRKGAIPGVKSLRVKRDDDSDDLRIRLKSVGLAAAPLASQFPLTVTINPGYLDYPSENCPPLDVDFDGCVQSSNGRSIECVAP